VDGEKGEGKFTKEDRSCAQHADGFMGTIEQVFKADGAKTILRGSGSGKAVFRQGRAEIRRRNSDRNRDGK
jgi:hypothetical protein